MKVDDDNDDDDGGDDIDNDDNYSGNSVSFQARTSIFCMIVCHIIFIYMVNFKT